MTTFTVYFIGGIVACKFFPFFPAAISMLCVLATLVLFIKNNKNRKKFVFVICALLAGFSYSFMQLETLPDAGFPNKDVFVLGTVIDVPEISAGKVGFTIDQVDIEGERLQGKVRMAIFKERFEEEISELLAPGDRISALARLKSPRFFRNPGVYSYDIKSKGIVAVGYIKQLKVIGSADGFLARIYRKRQELARIMDNSLSEENASFHKAIITGLKKGISREMRDAFSATGLAHLLSISGTHFGLLAFIIFGFIRFCVKSLPVRVLTKMTLYVTPTRIAVLITLPVLVLYALISGANTPTVRSLVMISIYMLALLLGRRGEWLNSLSIAAFIILLWNPGALFEISFILSFLAVLSIGCVLEKQESAEDLDAKYMPVSLPCSSSPSTLVICGTKMRTAMLITVAAVLGTAPVVVMVFKQLPLISPVTNLIVTPIICFVVLPFGFFSGFIALLFNMTTMPLSGLLDAFTYFSLKLVKLFSSVPFSNHHMHNPSFVLMALYYVSMVIFLKTSNRWRFLPFVLVVSIYFAGPSLRDDQLKVTFFDVGQGDATLVELPDKKVMLIDGGTYKPDTGRSVVAPYMWSKGLETIDYLVSSHPHSDHFGGLIYLMDVIDVKEIWLNGRTSFEAGPLFQKIREKKIPYRIPVRGDVLRADTYSIYILHPYDRFYSASAREEFSGQNNDSMVLKIETEYGSVLFTGDIETEAENDLEYLGEWLKSDIIKVPHHGGRTSSSVDFLGTVRPKIAVISAGRNNSFKHPHKVTLKRYEDAGIRLFRTDMSGAVSVIFDDISYRVETSDDKSLKKVLNWRDEIRNMKLLY